MSIELGPWESVRVRISLSCAALIWLVWESIVMFPKEYKYIWKGERSKFKCLYLFARYIALIGQTFNHVLTVVLLSRDSLDQNICRGWFAYQVVIVQSLYSSVEIVLMFRVYALYNRGFRVGVSMVALFVFETVFMLFTGAHSMMEFDFRPTCLVDKTPVMVLPMSAVAVTTQLLIWSLTLYKRLDSGRGLKNHPLMRIVTRDGAIVWGALTLFLSTVTPYAYYVKLPTHSTFLFFISMLSILGCRMIINTLRLQVKPTRSSDVELTTQCSLSVEMDSFDSYYST